MSNSNNLKPGILVNADVWQGFKEKVTNASDTLENFMSNYEPSVSSGAIIQVNKDIWQEFQTKYQGYAIQEVERLMQMAISSSPPQTSATVMSVSSGMVNSVSVPLASNWTVNYSSNSINLTQTSGTNSTMTYNCTAATPDIIINLTSGEIK